MKFYIAPFGAVEPGKHQLGPGRAIRFADYSTVEKTKVIEPNRPGPWSFDEGFDPLSSAIPTTPLE